jgi:SAM-dependent methyltransferase
MLIEAIKSLFNKEAASGGPTVPVWCSNENDPTPAVLNVGGNNKSIPIPAHYGSWRHLLLDISPSDDADIVMDSRKLVDFPAQQFDAVYCSHNLEHYYQHDVKVVLAGFSHVLKPGGFAEIHVPNMRTVLQRFIDSGMDINDVLYVSPSGPITVHDVIYGWGKEIEESGEDFYAHKTGFTEPSLMAALNAAGFAQVWTSESDDSFAIAALAFKQNPSPAQRALLGLPA